jgi:hypothetical protein
MVRICAKLLAIMAVDLQFLQGNARIQAATTSFQILTIYDHVSTSFDVTNLCS